MKRSLGLVAVLALVLLPSLAWGQASPGRFNPTGSWQYSFRGLGASGLKGQYSGTIVIDAQGRASTVTTGASGRQYPQHGRAQVGDNEVKILFSSAPDGYTPDQFHCTVQSIQTMNCFVVSAAGDSDSMFTMTRTSAPPPAAPNVQAPRRSDPNVVDNPCACFSLRQGTRSASQFPFAADNRCPVSVTYTVTICELSYKSARGELTCVQKALYMPARSSDSVTGYSDGKPAELVRVCAGGRCCAPPK